MALRANRGRLRLVEPSEPSELREGAPTTVPPSSGIQQPGDAVPALPGLPAGEGRASRPSFPSSPSLAELSPLPDAPGRNAPATAASRAQIAALSDAQLVALGCKGESLALEVLYRRHSAFAIHLAARIEGSSRDVEDIAHDAFVRAFERLGDLSDRAAFRSWLGSIVVHAVRSRMRRHRLMSVLGLKTAEPVDLDALASPDASPHVRAQIAQIYALLRTLATDDRIAWVLRCVEGHDLETVARLTRCSLATVKRRITRAQRFLDEHFVDPTEDASSGSPAASLASSPADSPEEVPS